jgi:hypothetical protein
MMSGNGNRALLKFPPDGFTKPVWRLDRSRAALIFEKKDIARLLWMSGYHVRFHREIRDRMLLDRPGLLPSAFFGAFYEKSKPMPVFLR